MSNDNIDRALGINGAASEEEMEILPPSVEVLDNRTAVTKIRPEDDYEYARQNLRDIIDSSVESLKDLQYVAKVSESPKAYEAMSGVVNALVDANMQLLDVNTKKNDAAAKEQGAPGKIIHNQTNIAFVGTTDELLKKVRRDNGEIDEEDLLQR